MPQLPTAGQFDISDQCTLDNLHSDNSMEWKWPMASVTEVRLVDDIDGGEAAETVAFDLEGKNYEIDLSETHAAKLREVLAPYVAAARRAGSSPTARGRR